VLDPRRCLEKYFEVFRAGARGENQNGCNQKSRFGEMAQ
jgi:hypothetical protein